jgi:hypothetical protein
LYVISGIEAWSNGCGYSPIKFTASFFNLTSSYPI